ncbi:diguanylate cyclase response regulator [Bradyrhizobium sp. SSBR45G]|uniref:response regulator n=1 Tax=unclassified Bradyrhizobium TaxID=2631580 RepID=UPI002342ABF2|nr:MULTISPECIES: response regulator [unclassified Bradyrhizobium]GLH81266.1 diguanylate cyclase response regulator [Bradyrhizobium sp. SSBR45G]GLH88714.1 diguanylate cyclase response regulator [Bradyrhizobium sp. SSBR45R]
MRILVVDDSEDGRDITEALLLSAGYEQVITAGSANEAYLALGIGASSAAPVTVDLVLLDIVMPDIDGIEACARIRKEPRLASVPIIMLTALGDTDNLGNAFVAGATDYITKPVDRVELLARVRSALKLKAEFDRREAREAELTRLASKSSDRRASHTIDTRTGLFSGEIAEAYLLTDLNFPAGTETSIVALAVDRLNGYLDAEGNPEAGVMARVAATVRAASASVGAVAAIYRDRVIVIILPNQSRASAIKLAETLRGSIAGLGISNPEGIAAKHFTASVAVVTERVNGAGRIHLLTRAIAAVSEIATAGGDCVVPQCA